MYPPYFIYPAVKELANSPSEERALQLQQQIVANVGSRRAISRLLTKLPEELNDFYPQDSTSGDASIDTFIAKYGGQSPLAASLILENDEPVEPVENEAEEASSDLEKEHTVKEISQPSPPDTAEQEFRRQLEKVKTLVGKRDYRGALQIMEAVYLNNPKKSIYFADQIRFIRKMMFNESKK